MSVRIEDISLSPHRLLLNNHRGTSGTSPRLLINHTHSSWHESLTPARGSEEEPAIVSLSRFTEVEQAETDRFAHVRQSRPDLIGIPCRAVQMMVIVVTFDDVASEASFESGTDGSHSSHR